MIDASTLRSHQAPVSGWNRRSGLARAVRSLPADSIYDFNADFKQFFLAIASSRRGHALRRPVRQIC